MKLFEQHILINNVTGIKYLGCSPTIVFESVVVIPKLKIPDAYINPIIIKETKNITSLLFISIFSPSLSNTSNVKYKYGITKLNKPSYDITNQLKLFNCPVKKSNDNLSYNVLNTKLIIKIGFFKAYAYVMLFSGNLTDDFDNFITIAVVIKQTRKGNIFVI